LLKLIIYLEKKNVKFNKNGAVRVGLEQFEEQDSLFHCNNGADSRHGSRESLIKDKKVSQLF
jgi:hypothetical protein